MNPLVEEGPLGLRALPILLSDSNRNSEYVIILVDFLIIYVGYIL